MNKVILVGRLTKDPELRTTASQVSVVSFALAVDRRYKNQQGERQADFIQIVAWRQTADFISRYFTKGARIGIIGNIQTRNWDDQEGKRHFATEVVAEEAYFVDSKGNNQSGGGNGSYAAPAMPQESAPSAAKMADTMESEEDFMPAPDDTVLPFDL